MLSTLQNQVATFKDIQGRNEGLPNLFKSTAQLAIENHLIDSVHEKAEHLRSVQNTHAIDQTVWNAFAAEMALTDQMQSDTHAKHHAYYVVRQQTQDRLYQDVLNSAKPKQARKSIKNIKPKPITKPTANHNNSNNTSTAYNIALQTVENAVDNIARAAIRKHKASE